MKRTNGIFSAITKAVFILLFPSSYVITSMAQVPVPVKPRILISTDIGGTDPDDNQSMAHYLMYNNLFNTEGLVSSPSYGSGNVSEILRMIDLYEKDLPQLKKKADGFPAPDYLRSISKQGRAGAAPYCGFQTATEGSDWIVRCARKECDQPLWVLVWGGLDDVAQALHDAPDIQEKIRIYWIGGPNKKWSTNSYAYIVNHFPNLWFIENNASYRGFIANYKQMDQFNGLYYDTFIRGGGNLGKDFKNYLNGNTKMGDTPSLLYMMDGNPDDPTKESWGGSFVKCTHSPQIIFDRPTTAQDTVQIYSIMEFRVKGPELEIPADSICMVMTINRQTWDGFYLGDGVYAVRHATYALGTMPYTIVSDIPDFPNQKGEITVENVWPGRQCESDFKLGDNWYTDSSDEALFHNNQHGFKTVSKWRIDAMSDWAERWSWLKKKKPRVIVTTDGEIDDQSSMVRFLMFSSDYDVAGIVQVNGVQKDGHSKDRWIEAQIEQYAQVVPNLRLHDPDYPEAESLMNVLKVGNEVRGDMYKAPPLLSHSEGAQLIIDVLLDDDPRPVHILAWGGANTQANALWQIKANHSPEAWQRAVSKARLYCIWYQDGGGKWIEEHLPEIVIYESGAPFRDGGWRYVWDYMSVDHYYKNRPSKNPKQLQAIMDKPWLTEQIKSGHGPLCAAYPQDYTSEGDSPSFMPLINNGLEQHLDYTLGGWGGRPEYRKGNHLQDGKDLDPSADTLSTHYAFQRWLPAAQNEWAAHADWCVKPYHQANHPPVISLKSSANLIARPGDEIKMEISANDPDGDRLTYRWWQYVEAGSYRNSVTLSNNDNYKAHFTIPLDAIATDKIHLICEVTDCGSPRLTRYQRFIISVESDLRDNLK